MTVADAFSIPIIRHGGDERVLTWKRYDLFLRQLTHEVAGDISVSDFSALAFVSDLLEERVPWLVSLQRELEEQPSVVSWLESSFTSHPTHKGRFVDKSKPHEIRAEAFAIVAESGHATLINSNRTAEGVWLPVHSLVLHVGYTDSVEFGTNRCGGIRILEWRCARVCFYLFVATQRPLLTPSRARAVSSATFWNKTRTISDCVNPTERWQPIDIH